MWSLEISEIRCCRVLRDVIGLGIERHIFLNLDFYLQGDRDDRGFHSCGNARQFLHERPLLWLRESWK